MSRRRRREVPESYPQCLGCHRHVKPATKRCPFCGADVGKLARQEAKQLEKIARLTAELSHMLGPLAKA